MAHATISSAVASSPLRRTMKAFTASPVVSSGTPTTATFSIFSWRYSTCSMSVGYTLKPETMIMSFLRSTMKKNPSSSIFAMSPVCSHRTPFSSVRIISSVSSFLFQYPSITCGPEITSSPDSPGPHSFAGSSMSTSLQSVSGTGSPMDPGLRRP